VSPVFAKVCFVSPCLALLGPAAPSTAQQSLAAERFVEIVLRSHPAARQRAALEEAARAERKAARSFLPDPSLEYSRGRARPGDGVSRGTETSTSVTQTLPWPGTVSAGVQAGDRAAEALRAAGEAVRWDLEVEARNAFARLLSARALLEIARSSEEDARSLRDLVARRAELGESRESDRLKTAVEWLRQQQALRAAERDAEAAEASARALAVEPLPRPLVLEGELPADLPPLDHDDVRRRLTERNPRLLAARAEAEMQRALTSVARRGRVPDLDLTLFRAKEIDKESSGFSLGVTLPLWNAKRGEIARAQAAWSLATAGAQRLGVDLVVELETRLKDLELAGVQAATLGREILPAAAQGLRLARFSYEEGETSLLDLLDAQRTYRETQREALESRHALALADGELQRLVGPDFNPWR